MWVSIISHGCDEEKLSGVREMASDSGAILGWQERVQPRGTGAECSLKTGHSCGAQLGEEHSRKTGRLGVSCQK